jgi:hypothetical protein
VSTGTGSSQNPVAKPSGTPHRVRVIIFRVVATLAGLSFVVAVAVDGVGALGAVAARSRDAY